MSQPKIAILILGYDSSSQLRSSLESVFNQTYRRFKVFFIDNHSKDNSLLFVKKQFPRCSVIANKENYGYAKGNNIGLKRVFEDDFDACVILNPDILLKPTALSELVKTHIKLATKNPRLGLIQPVILLNDERSRLNTAGNTIQILGYGYCKEYRHMYRLSSIDKPIASVSGSAMYIPKEYFREIGGFDDDFFMYNEDQQLSWLGLMRGYTHFLCSRSIAYHSYSFNKGAGKMYHTEKNRAQMLLTDYSLKTLVILSPLLIMNEFFICGYYLINGWIMLKIKAYAYILVHLPNILDKRKLIQAKKIVQDKDYMKLFDIKLHFAGINSRIITKLINPIFSGYFHLIKKLL